MRGNTNYMRECICCRISIPNPIAKVQHKYNVDITADCKISICSASDLTYYVMHSSK